MEQLNSLPTIFSHKIPNVSGTFTSEKEVTDAIHQLKDNGFAIESMSVAYLGTDPQESMDIVEHS